MLVTCPESAHLEEITYEDHPLGMRVTSCTAFSPACAVTCEQLCARRLDLKRRRRQAQFEEETFVQTEALVARP